ncbi:hypothetical protein C8F01DRAFT_129837 [Mycena amicta]|nr:hypothetical protein C8F01DRAFT_129837 [Mycena amicta]
MGSGFNRSMLHEVAAAPRLVSASNLRYKLPRTSQEGRLMCLHNRFPRTCTSHLLPSTIMHPIFSLENIATLPPDIRHVAEALVTPQTLAEDLEPLIDYVASSPPNDPLALSFLCVLYHILDPSGLPNDLSIANHTTQIRRAWAALLVWTKTPLLDWAVQAGAGKELWLRVWPWYRLFEEQEDALRRFDVLSSSSYSIPALRTMLIILLSTIIRLSEPIDLLFSTPGTLASLIRAWPAVYKMTNEKQMRHAMTLIMRVLNDEKLEEPTCLAPILTGDAGSVYDLARLLLVHLKIAGSQLQTYDFSSAPLHEDAELAASIFRAPFIFLRSVDDVFTMGSDKPPATHTTLGVALIEGGLLRIACEALEHMCRFEGGVLPTRIMHPMLDVLDILLIVPPGHQLLPEAISHGLLHSVLKLARRASRLGSPDAHFLSRSVSMFTSVLPNTLISVSVLNALKVLPELQALASAPAFRASSAFEIWEGFERLLTNRLEILERYNAGEFPARKMCDNFKCAVIDEEDKFKRCSGCRMAYYCSPSCQETDWRSGGHKKGCSSLRSLFAYEAELDLSPEDRDFLRVLMDVDLQRNRREIFLQTVPLILHQPGMEPLTHFNYTSRSSRIVDGTHISVVPVDDLAQLMIDAAGLGADSSLDHNLKGAWTYLLRRAKASEGRLMLDVVSFAVGAHGKSWLVPRYLQNPVLPKVRKVRAELVGRPTADSWVWGNFIDAPGDGDIEFH